MSRDKQRVASSGAVSLREMMAQQQTAMDIVEEKHNKEYIPLLTKAIKSVGGDPNVLHPSGGTDCTLTHNNNNNNPSKYCQKARQPYQHTGSNSSLRDIFATSHDGPSSGTCASKPSQQPTVHSTQRRTSTDKQTCDLPPTSQTKRRSSINTTPTPPSPTTVSKAVTNSNTNSPKRSPGRRSSLNDHIVTSILNNNNNNNPSRDISPKGHIYANNTSEQHRPQGSPSFGSGTPSNDTIIMTGPHGVIRASGSETSGLKALMAEQRIDRMAVDAQLLHHEELYGKYLGRCNNNNNNTANDAIKTSPRVSNNSDVPRPRSPTTVVDTSGINRPNKPHQTPVSSIRKSPVTVTPTIRNATPPKSFLSRIDAALHFKPTSVNISDNKERRVTSMENTSDLEFTISLLDSTQRPK